MLFASLLPFLPHLSLVDTPLPSQLTLKDLYVCIQFLSDRANNSSPLSSHSHQGYYKRTPEYLPTLHRKRVGCFKVPVVHSTVLIDLGTEESKRLQYWPPPEGFNGPVDDIVQFAFSAKKEGESEARSVHVCGSSLDVRVGMKLTIKRTRGIKIVVYILLVYIYIC